MLCQQCGNAIEEGRRGRAPVLAKFCLKCRSERRRLHSLKYVWLPLHEWRASRRQNLAMTSDQLTLF